jgi:hypothetical protein
MFHCLQTQKQHSSKSLSCLTSLEVDCDERLPIPEISKGSREAMDSLYLSTVPSKLSLLHETQDWKRLLAISLVGADL